MPTWDDVRRGLAEQHPSGVGDDDSILVPGDSPVVVRRLVGAGRPSAVALLIVCRATDSDPRRALAVNKDLEIGTLLAAKGMLVLRHLVDLERADALAELVRAIAAFAADGGRLRTLVSPPVTSRPVDVFNCYAD